VNSEDIPHPIRTTTTGTALEDKVDEFPPTSLNTPPMAAKGEDPIICRKEPFNICYHLDRHGNLNLLGDRLPVRLIRVYG